MKNQIELAKKLLESKGYTVRLKESTYVYRGPVYADRACTEKIADVDVEVTEPTPRAVAQAAGLDTDKESLFFLRTLPELKSGEVSQDLYNYNADMRLRDKAESKAREEFLNTHPDWDNEIDILELTASNSIHNYVSVPTQKIYAKVRGKDKDGVSHEDTLSFILESHRVSKITESDELDIESIKNVDTSDLNELIKVIIPAVDSFKKDLKAVPTDRWGTLSFDGRDEAREVYRKYLPLAQLCKDLMKDKNINSISGYGRSDMIKIKVRDAIRFVDYNFPYGWKNI